MSNEQYGLESRSSECKPLMDACTPFVYRENAFRITGLFTDASVRDIKRRINDLKHAEEMGDAEAEHSHAFALNPPPGLELVREAGLRLNDPERRIVEEFFWFWPTEWGNGRHDAALLALANGHKSAPHELWTQALSDGHSQIGVVSKHNLAVMYQMTALDQELRGFEDNHFADDSLAKIDRYWRACFKWWEELTDDESFWSLVSDRIRMLDDPRLTTGLSRRMRATLPEALDKINAMLAVRYIENGKLELAQKHIVYMKETHQGLDDVPKTLAMITESLQIRIRDAIGKAAEVARQQPEKAAQTARELLTAVSQPLEITMGILPPEDADRIDLCDSAAGTVMHCAIIYGNKTEKWETCTSLLEASLEIAVDVELRKNIEEGLLTVRQNAEHQQLVGTCWFCKRKKAEEDSALEIPMYGDVARRPTLTGIHVTFRTLVVSVPRCRRCKSVHRRTGKTGSIMAPVGAIIGGCIGSVFTLSATGAIVGGFAGLVIGAGVMGPLVGSAIQPSDVASAAKHKDYPQIKELRSQGWLFGEKPS